MQKHLTVVGIFLSTAFLSGCMTAGGMMASAMGASPEGAKELPTFTDPNLAELQTTFVQNQREYYAYKRDFASLQNAGTECPADKVMSAEAFEKNTANQQQIAAEIAKLTGAGSGMRMVMSPPKNIELRIIEGDCNGGNVNGAMKMLVSWTSRMDAYGTMRFTDETQASQLIIGNYIDGMPTGDVAKVMLDIKTFTVKPDGTLVPKKMGLVVGDINDRLEDMPANVSILRYQDGKHTYQYDNMKSMMGAVHMGWTITALEPMADGGSRSTSYQGKNVHSYMTMNSEGQLHGRYKTFYGNEYVKDIDVCFENGYAIATTDC